MAQVGGRRGVMYPAAEGKVSGPVSAGEVIVKDLGMIKGKVGQVVASEKPSLTGIITGHRSSDRLAGEDR
jgi:hypothetical protein